jgi:hypothetical protein
VNCALLRVARMVIRADSDPARVALFAKLVESRPFPRLVFRLHEGIRGTWASALLLSGYGLGSFLTVAPARNGSARVLAFARHANARRQVSLVGSWLGKGEWGAVRSGVAAADLSGVLALAALMARPRLLTLLRIVRRLDTRHGFLVACRVAGAIGWYARARVILARHRPAAVLVSSDSQPEEAGFVAAAAGYGIHRIFVSHAYPTPLSPPLNFTLSILEGEAELEARRQKGPVRGKVILAGIDSESAPIDPRRVATPNPVIGIFAPKAISAPAFAALVEECRTHFGARQVIVRWHPSTIERSHVAHLMRDTSRIHEAPAGAALVDVARQCDWVVADVNSHVHLPVLKLGIPTVAVPLGVYPPSRADQYGFVAAGIVYRPAGSIRSLTTEAMTAFFDDEWATRFARYDASYLRPPGELASEVRQAIRALYHEAPRGAHASQAVAR